MPAPVAVALCCANPAELATAQAGEAPVSALLVIAPLLYSGIAVYVNASDLLVPLLLLLEVTVKTDMHPCMRLI